jgi:vacuolar-type H+-ATPase subunit I/STV1
MECERCGINGTNSTYPDIPHETDKQCVIAWQYQYSQTLSEVRFKMDRLSDRVRDLSHELLDKERELNDVKNIVHYVKSFLNDTNDTNARLLLKSAVENHERLYERSDNT